LEYSIKHGQDVKVNAVTKIEYVDEKLIEHGISAEYAEHVAESHGQIEDEKEEIQEKNGETKAYVALEIGAIVLK